MKKRSLLRVASSALVLALSAGAAAGVAPQSQASRAIVSIPAEGQYRFGDERIERKELSQRIGDALYDLLADEQMIDLNVDENVSYGTVRDTFNIIRNLGYDEVRLRVIRKGVRDDDALLDARIVPLPVGVKNEYDAVPDWKSPERPQSDQPPPPAPPSSPPPSWAPTKVLLGAEPLRSDALVVEMAVGTVAVNTKAMPPERLRPFLNGVFESRPDDERHVYLKAPKNVTFGEVAATLSDVEAAGASFVFLILDDIPPPRKIVAVPPRPPSRGVTSGVPGGVGRDAPKPPPVKPD